MMYKQTNRQTERLADIHTGRTETGEKDR